MASSAIHTSRLGGHAFNHRTSEDVEAEYDRLRDLARAEGGKMESCFERSREAYQRGDGALAKQLSDEGKRYKKKQEEYNKQASDFIFRENNHPDRVPEDAIDLHGQFVREAEAILEARIRHAREAGQSHLHVIVGKGKHSAGGVQKLKPCVERLCQDLGLNYATEENEGRIYVDLRGRKVDSPPPMSRPSGDYSDGESRPHRPQQRPPKQHHQRPPPPKEEEEEGLLGCLRFCCTVM
ncbi:hypothetical protein VTJ83DRAFT_2591 [Remersonia thermophila]|uniref:Smr domain-containing protein n=1 Tax=Remersonia thermophila TaxID=72144 RepID=A0ABR4DLF6_9PEZI